MHPIVLSIVDNLLPADSNVTQMEQSMVKAQVVLEMAMSQPGSDNVEMEDDLDKDTEGKDFNMEDEGDGMKLAKLPSITMKDSKGKEKAVETYIERTGIPFCHIQA